MIFHVQIDGRPIALTTHPAADVFPMLNATEFGALCADIEAHGLQQKIALDHLGMTLLDGRNRLKACQTLGIAPAFDRLPKDADEIAFVVSANLRRRHLSSRLVDQRLLPPSRQREIRRVLDGAINDARVCLSTAGTEGATQ